MTTDAGEDPEGPPDGERIRRMRAEWGAWAQLKGAEEDLGRSISRLAKASYAYLCIGRRDAWDAINGLGDDASRIFEDAKRLLKDLDDAGSPRQAGAAGTGGSPDGDGPGKETKEP